MNIKKTFLAVASFGVVSGLGLATYLFWPLSYQQRDFTGIEGDVSRGAYLARASGCFACHTNTKNKGAILAGGGPMKTPFGTFYAPNITTDKNNGIGNWNLTDFSNALTHGINPKGENYYPVFLYPNYTSLSNQDISDLWAAFKTVPPDNTKVPEHDLKFPFQYRILLTAWKNLFFKNERYKPNPEMSKEWNRGAFLAKGPTHCAACHTPQNLLGGQDYDQELNGNKAGPGGEKVPPITATALLKNKWTKNDIVFALRTGTKPDGDAFGGSMGEVVTDGTSYLSDQDLNAIAEYVMSVEHKNGKSVVKVKIKK